MKDFKPTKSESFAERIHKDLPIHFRVDWQEFLDSFEDDIIASLVRQFGGWNGRTTYGTTKAVIFRMMEAWQAGRNRLRENIQDML